MYCIHRGHLFPVGNKTLHTYKGGYIVGILRLLDTPFQSRGFLHLEKGSLKVYPLAYMAICRLARLEGLCGGHCQLPLNKSGKLQTGFAEKRKIKIVMKMVQSDSVKVESVVCCHRKYYRCVILCRIP